MPDLTEKINQKISDLAKKDPFFDFLVYQAPLIINNFISKCLDKLILFDNYQSIPIEKPIDWENIFQEYKLVGLKITPIIKENNICTKVFLKKNLIAQFDAELKDSEIIIQEKFYI